MIHSNKYLPVCSLQPTFLSPQCRYDKIIQALNCPGYLAKTPTDLDSALRLCLQTTDRPSLVNVLIDPMAMRKQQVSLFYGMSCRCISLLYLYSVIIIFNIDITSMIL